MLKLSHDVFPMLWWIKGVEGRIRWMQNKTSRKFPAHESGAGGSVAYFLAKADFFLTNADLQEGALGHALLCIQCLISRDLGAKQWPATKHWLQGQIIDCGKGGSIKRWPENDGEDGGGDCPASLICVSLTSSYWFSWFYIDDKVLW